MSYKYNTPITNSKGLQYNCDTWLYPNKWYLEFYLSEFGELEVGLFDFCKFEFLGLLLLWQGSESRDDLIEHDERVGRRRRLQSN